MNKWIYFGLQVIFIILVLPFTLILLFPDPNFNQIGSGMFFLLIAAFGEVIYSKKEIKINFLRELLTWVAVMMLGVAWGIWNSSMIAAIFLIVLAVFLAALARPKIRFWLDKLLTGIDKMSKQF